MYLFQKFPQQPTLEPLPIASTSQPSTFVTPLHDFYEVKPLWKFFGNELVQNKEAINSKE